MVHVPTRGDVPVRLGPDVQLVPDLGPSVMDREVYTDPVRFELERERVLATHWILAGRSAQVAEPGDWITFEGHGEIVRITSYNVCYTKLLRFNVDQCDGIAPHGTATGRTDRAGWSEAPRVPGL